MIGWCLGLLVVSRLERFVKIIRLRCSCQDCFQIVLRSAILRRTLQTKHSGSGSSYLASLILSCQRHCLLELHIGWWLQIPLWLAFHHDAHLTTDQLVYVVRFPVFLHRGILPYTERASCAHKPSLRIGHHLWMLLLHHFLGLCRAVFYWVKFRYNWFVLVVSDSLCQIDALVYKLLASAPQLLVLLLHSLAHLEDVHAFFLPNTRHRWIVGLEHLELKLHLIHFVDDLLSFLLLQNEVLFQLVDVYIPSLLHLR